jgi:hypothetical protein
MQAGHPSPFTLHPSPFILHPSSFILHPSSFILLELMPLRLNMGKKDTMGQRQLDLLRRFRQAGLL